MTRSTILRLRGLWFQVHKWIGLSLAILIIPISISGAALVWHDWLDETINPQRYAVTGEAALGPAAYAAAAQAALGPGERIASIRYPEHGRGPVVVAAVRPGKGRPVRTNVWLDPGSARLLDAASADAGTVRFLHVLHGSLAMPGWGRTIVGWVGLFMFVSCLTGLWLWWPLTGSLRRGWRWKRQNSANANLHHLVGFWVLLPLAMLSFTGAWISFPGLFGGPERPRAAPASPLAETAMTADSALALARAGAGGAPRTIGWPTDRSPTWRIAFARAGGGAAEVEVDDGTGAVKPPPAPPPETYARLMRRLHDGTGMGAVWQIVIFLGGIIPAILAVTGIVMWLRSRGWRAALAKKRKAGRLALQPAE
ncbi:MAG TPA: PepSY-associated TM helix domain-containing protein [Allosphingosinicella sp.]|nr:PepSY-associated TM helix domain-containing protein [Allosphingosinicella sp.]